MRATWAHASTLEDGTPEDGTPEAGTPESVSFEGDPFMEGLVPEVEGPDWELGMVSKKKIRDQTGVPTGGCSCRGPRGCR